MEFKNKTGYHLVPPEGQHMKESPIYNDEDGDKEADKKKKERKERMMTRRKGKGLMKVGSKSKKKGSCFPMLRLSRKKTWKNKSRSLWRK
ncbi:hypothetical protein QN277_008813 [Acacia crassicarpa]|uniref:Uncharacterized protein n=1 Tax=Acacia crassicarpa TaxID=499986 RepID=A0AAE1IR31_9FABA|nr:hypothetical protein QN277_008813 [Acacia crassicarpa]